MFDNFLGIDVSSESFDVALREAGGKLRQKRFANTQQGAERLIAWLGQPTRTHACLEATGGYELALACQLHRAGLRVSLVNPVCTRSFATAQLRRAKTDPVDARDIASFCQALRPTPWSPPAPELIELRHLVRRLPDLQQMVAQETCRRKAPGLSAAVATSLERHLAELATGIAQLRKEIRALFARHPQLAHQRDLLASIPGVGEATALVLLAECATATHCQRARQLGAYAGLTPKPCQSGKRKGKTRICKQGNSNLRRALYWPAVTAMRHNPRLVEFARRLLANGKAKLQVICAVMRKLLHQAFAILRDDRPFDPNYQAARG